MDRAARRPGPPRILLRGLNRVRILVVDDEPVMADSVATALRRSGHAVDIAFDGAEALERAWSTRYDVVVLDRDLPNVHGDDVCRQLADEGSARVLLLTAAGSLSDRVHGLELGADDYLPKPFAIDELRARVAALGRRSVRAQRPTLVVGNLVIDTAARTASRDGRDLGLSLKELGVLEVLASSPGAVVSAEELLERVWDENADPFTSVVRVTMVGLRRKLGVPGIETVRGAGYRLAVPQ